MKCVVEIFIALQKTGGFLKTRSRVEILFASADLAEGWLSSHHFKKKESLARTALWESSKSEYVIETPEINMRAKKTEEEVIRATVKTRADIIDTENINFI